MIREEDYADGIDFRRRYKRYGHSRMHLRLPSPSHYRWYEALILIALGLIAGFGLGLAYAMLMLTFKV